MKLLLILTLFITIYDGFECQVYYQPVQVFIPTFNGTIASNQSLYNTVPSPVPPQPPGLIVDTPSVLTTTYPANPFPVLAHTASVYKPPAQTGYYPTYNNNQTNYYNYNNGSQDGHLFLGTIQAFDRLLYQQEFTKLKRFWSSREKIIEYPKDLPSGYSRHETISALRVYNEFLDGHGAKAELLDGGIGRQLVKIRLRSPFGKGFRYRVLIYGR